MCTVRTFSWILRGYVSACEEFQNAFSGFYDAGAVEPRVCLELGCTVGGLCRCSESAATCALASAAVSPPRATSTSFSNNFWLLSPASITSELIAIITRRRSSVSTNDLKFHLQRREDRSCQDGCFGRCCLVVKWRGGFWKQRRRNPWVVRLNKQCLESNKYSLKSLFLW